MLMRHNAVHGYAFITRKGSRKLKHISANPDVQIVVGNITLTSTLFVTVTADAAITEDAQVKKDYWDDSLTKVKNSFSKNVHISTVRLHWC